MFNAFKKLIYKIIRRHYYNSDTYVNYLRNKGCTIGCRTIIYSPQSVTIDVTRPHMVQIGDDVKITKGVTILTHGYDFSVLRNVYNETFGSAGKVIIGNNVFIGVNTTILKSVTIGNNVIIGANSLVNKSIEDNVVYAGNPAKFIMTLEDYYKKRKTEYLYEAKEMVMLYVERNKKLPPITEFNEFFPLFLARNKDVVRENGFDFSKNMANPDEFFAKYLNSKPLFNSFDEFIEWCLKEDSSLG